MKNKILVNIFFKVFDNLYKIFWISSLVNKKANKVTKLFIGVVYEISPLLEIICIASAIFKNIFFIINFLLGVEFKINLRQI